MPENALEAQGDRTMFQKLREALRVLDNVQTHDLIGPNADKALFWLGESHDPRAIDVFEEILRK